jgi:serine/threonine protein kinase
MFECEEQINEERKNTWYVDDFLFGECLGFGKFGYVYKAVESSSKKELAIKLICKNTILQSELVEQLKNEIEIHSRLKYAR